MSKQASPIAVGSFVIGAIVLIIASVLILGSGKFFVQSHTVMSVFPGNVKGLRVGAAVEFRGVRVGSVTNIRVMLDKQKDSVYVPVYFKIEEGVVEDMHFAEMGGDLTEVEWRDEVDKLIKGGLRAQLVMQSFVTGQSIIDIDFHPDEPRKLTNIDPAVVEIPTVETSIGKMMNKLENLPLDQLVNKAVDTLTGIDQLVRSQEVRDTVHNANLALQSAHKLLNNVDLKVDPLATSAKGTIDQARGTLVSVEKKLDTTLSSFTRLSRNLNRQVKPLSKSAIGALDSIDGLVGTESGTRADLDNMINELAEAARSLRILANYLEQHPESLIKGKGY